ncbi:RNA chaperone ProQ [Alteromonadaceae bacterium M269]|nr:RNA chaperone ProQ [Alteromonadaceae bacterium M269]
MENPQKFASNKEVIAFLAETFPACFSIEGEAKPLKIGIFQDLAERLGEDPRVSKTMLRSTLRHYTNSWRYLHSIKAGVPRVNLDGEDGDLIEQQHADHALEQLNESKKKVAEKRKEKKALQNPAKKSYKNKQTQTGEAALKRTNSTKAKVQRKQPVAEKLTDASMIPGTSVTVKIGKSIMQATITEVAKDDIHVQLESGMSVKVQANQLRLARTKR